MLPSQPTQIVSGISGILDFIKGALGNSLSNGCRIDRETGLVLESSVPNMKHK